jgi:hypothetical protein
VASYRLAPGSLKAWADFGYARPTPACMNTSVLGSVYICRNRRLLFTTSICCGLREGPRLHPGLMSRSRATQRLAGLPRVIENSPFFLKFCSYFPYNAKLYIYGNEYAKCQLRKRGIAFEALRPEAQDDGQR